MSIRGNNKKTKQLGMPFGTANGRLKKMILFDLIKKLNLNFCYRCGFEIENEGESCNCKSVRNAKIGTAVHPSVSAYTKRGCRCLECCKLHTENYRTRKHRKK